MLYNPKWKVTAEKKRTVKNLRKLAKMLRKQQQFEDMCKRGDFKVTGDRFKWDFSTIITIKSCGTRGCAMGLWELGKARVNKYGHFNSEAFQKDFFALSAREQTHLFESGGYEDTKPTSAPSDYDHVTPEMVADQIDKLIEKKGWAYVK